MTSFDCIVIGGGHNGLVCAATLARSGRKVLVLDAADAVGGAARPERFFPGCRVSTAHVLNRLHPEVVKTLELEKHGLLRGTPTPNPSPQGGGEQAAAFSPMSVDMPATESPSPLWGGARG